MIQGLERIVASEFGHGIAVLCAIGVLATPLHASFSDPNGVIPNRSQGLLDTEVDLVSAQTGVPLHIKILSELSESPNPPASGVLWEIQPSPLAIQVAVAHKSAVEHPLVLLNESKSTLSTAFERWEFETALQRSIQNFPDIITEAQAPLSHTWSWNAHWELLAAAVSVLVLMSLLRLWMEHHRNRLVLNPSELVLPVEEQL